MNDTNVSGVHWSFWAIGAVGLAFNVMGCINLLSQMNADMVASMPEAHRTLIESRPAWGTGAFAVAVFGAAIGGILLLLKKSIAYYLFIASLLGAVVAQIPILGVASFPMLVGGLSQIVVTAFLLWYSKRSENKGWVS